MFIANGPALLGKMGRRVQPDRRSVTRGRASSWIECSRFVQYRTVLSSPSLAAALAEPGVANTGALLAHSAIADRLLTAGSPAAEPARHAIVLSPLLLHGSE